MDPLVSLVIPNHNGAATIERCVAAALASQHAKLEVIVVDDGSVDDSLERIRRLPCRVIALPRRRGAAAARNAGARESRGEVLFFTDADCLLQPDAVTQAVATLGGAADLAVGGTYTPVAPEASFFDRFQSVFVHHFETRHAPHTDYLATHALAIAPGTLQRHGGFAEDGLPILEDVEFSHRLRRGGCRLVMNPAIQARHVFRYSFARSLRNAYRKARYWTCYSLGAGDLLADSGTASHLLKLNVGAWCAGAALLVTGLAFAAPAGIVAAAALLVANASANRGLVDAFRRAHGIGFAAAATLYYLLVYPVAVGAGAVSGAWLYGTRPRGKAKPA
ncbi:MAG: glycosyltransferase [Betaproteobacteria bacterium]|nr:MAG: glycosyltransferase [Betaproteobacteria bacterium]